MTYMVRFSWGNGKRLNENPQEIKNRVGSVEIVFGMKSFGTDLGLSGRKSGTGTNQTLLKKGSIAKRPAAGVFPNRFSLTGWQSG
jgi:hypothetical protein